MSESYKIIESRIQEAIVTLSQSEKPNVAKTAHDHKVPEDRLQNRWKGRLARTERPAANKKLNEEQEIAVCRYLDRLDKIGIAAQRQMLADCANAILRRNHIDFNTPPPTVGKNWPRRFLDTHPEYHLRKQKSLDVERKLSHQPDNILSWFRQYHEVVEQHGIIPNDTYNFDETGFRIGIRKDQWIITRDPTRQAYFASSNNRELVSCIETVSGDGTDLPPMIILSATNLLEQWFTNDLPGDVLVAVSDTGHSNDHLSLHWLRHFKKYSKKRQVRSWRLLLFDGYGSHCTYDFLKFCDDHRIIPFCLPPYSTHLLQPLDVVIFQPFKHFHALAVDTATRTGCTDFNKSEFLTAITSIRQQTFKNTTIRSAFRKTGLIPYNPQIVIEKLREYEPKQVLDPRTSSPTPAIATCDPFNTPATVRTLKRHSEQIKEIELSPSAQRTIGKFIKGSLILAQSGAQAEEDYQHTQATEQIRAKRQKHGRRQVSSAGRMYARDAREVMQKRSEEEVVKAQKALRKVELVAHNEKMTPFREMHRELKVRVKAREAIHKQRKVLCREIRRYCKLLKAKRKSKK